jgi:hypothetical protein
MKNRTLRVATGNTISEEKQIENGVVPGSGIECHAIFSGNGGDNTESKNP